LTNLNRRQHTLRSAKGLAPKSEKRKQIENERKKLKRLVRDRGWIPNKGMRLRLLINHIFFIAQNDDK